MPNLSDILRACPPLLPEPFLRGHAGLFAEEHLGRVAGRLLTFWRDGVPTSQPPPHFAAEQTPPLNDAFACFHEALEAWQVNPDAADLPRRFADALVEAGCARLLLLLGQRLTPASLTDARAIPPPRERLLDSTRRPHADGELLTVGARALAKHVHRSPEAFWGKVTGSVAQKNAAALLVLQRILDTATWWNVFGHFQHETVYEARVPTGHGARWGQGGGVFIGFLEPFDEGRGVRA